MADVEFFSGILRRATAAAYIHGELLRLTAGTNVTISTPDSEGRITISATGGGGGGGLTQEQAQDIVSAMMRPATYWTYDDSAGTLTFAIPDGAITEQMLDTLIRGRILPSGGSDGQILERAGGSPTWADKPADADNYANSLVLAFTQATRTLQATIGRTGELADLQHSVVIPGGTGGDSSKLVSRSSHSAIAGSNDGDIENVNGTLFERTNEGTNQFRFQAAVDPTDSNIWGIDQQRAANKFGTDLTTGGPTVFKGYPNTGQFSVNNTLVFTLPVAVFASAPDHTGIFFRIRNQTSGFTQEYETNARYTALDDSANWGYQVDGRFEQPTAGDDIDVLFYSDATYQTPLVVTTDNVWQRYEQTIYSNSTLDGTGQRADPFGVADGAITPGKVDSNTAPEQGAWRDLFGIVDLGGTSTTRFYATDSTGATGVSSPDRLRLVTRAGTTDSAIDFLFSSIPTDTATFALATGATGRIPVANSRVESVRTAAALNTINTARTAEEGVLYPQIG